MQYNFRGKFRRTYGQRGFTIVELLIVIVVIGILASVVIVAYSGISQQAKVASLQSDIANGVSILRVDNVMGGKYPATASAVNNGQGFRPSADNIYTYNVSVDGSIYCLQVSGSGVAYFATSSNTTPQTGTCDGTTGVPGNGDVGANPDVYYPSATIGNPVNSNDDGAQAGVVLGMKFGTHQSVEIKGARWYAIASTAGVTVDAALFNESNDTTILVQSNVSGVLAVSGWNEVLFTTPYTVVPGQTYIMKVRQSGTTKYTSMASAYPITQEPLYVVNPSAGGWNYTSDITQSLADSTAWYGIDVIMTGQ